MSRPGLPLLQKKQTCRYPEKNSISFTISPLFEKLHIQLITKIIPFSLHTGAQTLKFLNRPPPILSAHVGTHVDFNCSTDDPNATVTLLFTDDFGTTWRVKSLASGRLVLRDQVFTLMDVVLRDGGGYGCNATDQSGQTIQWPNSGGIILYVRSGMFILLC